MAEGVWVHGADNPMGDSGIDAVVRMAATTPSLKKLDLRGVCVCVCVSLEICCVGCGSVDGWAAHGTSVRHNGGRGEVRGVMAG